MARTVEVNLTVDSSGAVTGVTAAGKAFEEVGEDAREAGADVDRGMEQAEQSTRQFAASADRAADAQRNMRKASSNATQILFSAGDAVQDVQFGFAGAANNIAFMAEQFTDVQRQAGGTRAAFSAIGSSLLGAGGVIFAFQALLALAPQIIKFFSDTTEASKETREALQEIAGEFINVEEVAAGFEDISPEQAERLTETLTSMRDAITGRDGIAGPIDLLRDLQDALETLELQDDPILGEGVTGAQVVNAERIVRLRMEQLGLENASLGEVTRRLEQEEEQLEVIEASLAVLQSATTEAERRLRVEELLERIGLQRKEDAKARADAALSQLQTMQALGTAALELSRVDLSNLELAELPQRLREVSKIMEGLRDGTISTADAIDRLRDIGTRLAREALRQIEAQLSSVGGAIEAVDWGDVGDQIESSLAPAFEQLGASIAQGESALASFGQAAGQIIATVLRAIGQQFLAIGASLLLINPGLGAAYLAAGALFTAGAGAISALTGGGVGGGGGQGASAAGGGRERFETGGQAGLGSGASSLERPGQNQQQAVTVDTSGRILVEFRGDAKRVLQGYVREAQDRDAALRGVRS